MTLELTDNKFKLLVRTTRLIAQFCEQSPNTAALLDIDTPDRLQLQQIADTIAQQYQEQKRQQLHELGQQLQANNRHTIAP